MTNSANTHPWRVSKTRSEMRATMDTSLSLMYSVVELGLGDPDEWRGNMEEYVEKGQLTGQGSPGCWWQIEQKRPQNTPWPAIVLTAHIHNGSWQPQISHRSKVYYFWNAFTQNLLTTFTTLSNASHVTPPSWFYLLCLIVCHLPVKWAANHGKVFHLSVREKVDWEWQYQKKRKKMPWSGVQGGRLSYREHV